MGSKSDWETMCHAAEMLDRLGVAHETKIVSAHRTPDRLYDYARSARERGLKVIIAGAGGPFAGNGGIHDDTPGAWSPCRDAILERHG